MTGEAIEEIGVFSGFTPLEIVIDAAAKSLAVGDNEGVGVVDVVVDFVLCAVAQAVEVVVLDRQRSAEGFVYDLCAERIVAVVLVGLAHSLLQRGFAEIGRREVGAECHGDGRVRLNTPFSVVLISGELLNAFREGEWVPREIV